MSEEQVVETQLEQPQQPQMGVVDDRPLPKILNRQIDQANETLVATQERLQQEISDSAEELMEMIGLDQSDGWFIDLENRRFVKVGPVQSGETAETSDAT